MKNRKMWGLGAVFALILSGCAVAPEVVEDSPAEGGAPWDDDGYYWYTWVEEDYVRAGDRYFAHENYDGAIYWYERGLEENPGSHDLNAGLQRANAGKPEVPAPPPPGEEQPSVQLVERVPGFTVIVEVDFGSAKVNEWALRTAKIRGIFPGVAHILILREDGTLWGGGYNHSGQLGIRGSPEDSTGGYIPENPPVTRITDNMGAPVYNVKSAAAGENHTLIVMDDGTLWGAGESLYGEFGLGGSGAVKLPGLTKLDITGVRSVAAGNNNTFVIKDDGTLWAAGHNYYGELGLGDRNYRTVFTRVSGAGRDVKAVSIGARHTVILKNDGTVWTAGYNFNGQLGQGNNADSARFTQVRFIGRNAKAVAAGSYHTVVLMKDGTVWTVGENFYNQLGWDDAVDRNQFTQVVDNNGYYIAGAKDISARGNLTLVLTGEDTLLLAGSFDDPVPRDEMNLPPEQPVFNRRPASSFILLEAEDNAVLRNIDKIVLGNQSVYVVTGSDRLLVAGSNRYGQLSLGFDTEVSPVLKPVNP